MITYTMNPIFHSRSQHPPPILLIHGGAGALPEAAILKLRQEALATIGTEVWAKLNQGLQAVEAVTLAVEKLEDCPLFNAGRGAVLQSDGLARLSASVMDGARQKFSGVMLATHLLHPSRLAAYLQSREESVVGPLGAQLIARELGIPPQSPLTPETIERWAKTLAQRGSFPQDPGIGTVGAVALDLNSRLAAATSTGGGSANFPERISDSATVAGNYASSYAAISCTGKGEQIVDDGLAVRLETRVRDGQSLILASRRTLEEARANRCYGWIGVDRAGNWVVACTAETIFWWGNSSDVLPRMNSGASSPL